MRTRQSFLHCLSRRLVEKKCVLLRARRDNPLPRRVGVGKSVAVPVSMSKRATTQKGQNLPMFPGDSSVGSLRRCELVRLEPVVVAAAAVVAGDVQHLSVVFEDGIAVERGNCREADRRGWLLRADGKNGSGENSGREEPRAAVGHWRAHYAVSRVGAGAKAG